MTTVPAAFKATYQTKHFNAGLPVGGESVFDALYSPPASGVAAEAAAAERAKHVELPDGSKGDRLQARPDEAALLRTHAHRDWMRDFYDSASILRPANN